jgi:hypothetical protein
MLDTVTTINCQKSNQTLTSQIGYYSWDKLLYVLFKTNKGICGQQLKFTMNKLKTRSWTCLEQIKFRNSNFIICTIILNHFPSMVNNRNPSLVAVEPQKKLDLWTFWIKNITMNIIRWTNDDIHYMTIFTHFLKWRCNMVIYRQHPGHLENKTKTH